MPYRNPDDKKNYIYIPSNSGYSLRGQEDYFSSPLYVDKQQYKYLPLSSSINIKYYNSTESDEENTKRRRLHALKNILNRNSIRSQHYLFSSSLGDKLNQDLTLISIPSIFYGTTIKKGSVELTINYDGQNIAKLSDTKLNGELIETVGNNTGSVAGVVLYDEGFILLTGSWNQNIIEESVEVGTRWNCFGTGSEHLVNSGSFDINFNGTNEIQTVTMMAHAEKHEFNHSNNPTYVKYDSNKTNYINYSETNYREDEYREIKNITKYEYENYSGSLEKEVYISKIGIYDEHKNLIAVAKLATPVRKTSSRDFTFKLKLDI